MKETYEKKPNAFDQPNNPEAVFPQRVKENNIDFRMSAIVGGGYSARFTNRRDLPGSKAKHSKYESIVKTNEDLAIEEEERKQHEIDEMNADIEDMKLGDVNEEKK